jgi:CheY-like chemotaxis protein
MNDERTYVLVLDDDHDTADSMAWLLSLWDFESRAYYAGPAALDAARARRPDAVLLDLGLPRMGGCEFARLLRALPGCAECVLVALTGHTTAACRALARAAGVDHYLLKPADLDRLRELLERVVPQRGLVQTGRRPRLVSAGAAGPDDEMITPRPGRSPRLGRPYRSDEDDR